MRRSPFRSITVVTGLALGLGGCVEMYGAACDKRVDFPPVRAEQTTGFLRVIEEGTCICLSSLDRGNVLLQLDCENSSAPGASTANLPLFFTSVGDTPHVDVAISPDEVGIYSEVDDPCTRVIGYFGTFHYGPPRPPPDGWEDLGTVRAVHVDHLLVPSQEAGSPLICPDAAPIPIEEGEAFGVDLWCVE